jgi:hypothetical protein
MREYGDVNFIIGKTLRVLPETKSPKPGGNLLHIASRFAGPLPGRMNGLCVCQASVADFARSSAWLRSVIKWQLGLSWTRDQKPQGLRVKGCESRLASEPFHIRTREAALSWLWSFVVTDLC